jgi:putative transposase
MNAIAHREEKEVAAELAGIWKQERKEDALLNLAASTRKISEALPRSDSQSERTRASTC